ncbi:interleukin-34 [Austrofundulus limnaeus]|uniref:Interleukin-34 n=1 Tax=Austrofundulus limnaeus TaxID=52670 RepID=A0A2I4D9K0_AUSLI|nr:PREDICTED: interleukin-34 [Austrofundulus limnaeus]
MMHRQLGTGPVHSLMDSDSVLGTRAWTLTRSPRRLRAHAQKDSGSYLWKQTRSCSASLEGSAEPQRPETRTPRVCMCVHMHTVLLLKPTNMVPPSLCFLGGLLGLLVMVPVLTASSPASMCTPLRTLNDSLSHRRRYMKHNFPINYSIQVYRQEIFKLSNISRMRLKVEGLDELVLQRLWFQVNQGVLKKIIRVLPDRHPSRSYTAELERRFRDAEGVFVQSHPAEVFQQELPEKIQDIWDQLTEESDRVPESSWRLASPKSLVDSLCQTMLCLFRDCFSSEDAPQDYCGVFHSRRNKKTSSPNDGTETAE